MEEDAGGESVYAFGPFRLDARERLLTRDGRPVAVKPKVFDTLLVLVSNAGRIVRKEELMDAIWPETIVAESNLTQNVWAARKALDESDEGPRYVETVPRAGYRFVAPVALVPRETAVPTGALSRPRHGRFAAVGLAGGASLLLVAAA